MKVDLEYKTVDGSMIYIKNTHGSDVSIKFVTFFPGKEEAFQFETSLAFEDMVKLKNTFEYLLGVL